MRFFYFLFLIIPLVFQNQTNCNKQNKTSDCFKGRLEIKGICANYVISIIEGNADTSRVVESWKDPVTGKNYARVFKLDSPCTFPETINEGDEFYFTFTDKSTEECVVCLAYRPVPEKKNMIIVSKTPCNP